MKIFWHHGIYWKYARVEESDDQTEDDAGDDEVSESFVNKWVLNSFFKYLY